MANRKIKFARRYYLDSLANKLDIIMLEKIKNRGKIDRTFDWFRKEKNANCLLFAQIKSQLLNLLKKLGSGSERPHDSCLQHTAVERHRPERKGLRLASLEDKEFKFLSKDIALIERDWDPSWFLPAKPIFKSKDIALNERDWDARISLSLPVPNVERHRPARKGLRRSGWYLIAIFLYVERHRPARKGLRRL